MRAGSVDWAGYSACVLTVLSVVCEAQATACIWMLVCLHTQHQTGQVAHHARCEEASTIGPPGAQLHTQHTTLRIGYFRL